MEATRRSKKQTKADNAARNTQAAGTQQSARPSARLCSHPKEVLHCGTRPATPENTQARLCSHSIGAMPVAPLVQVRLIRDASAPRQKIKCAADVVRLCSDMKHLDREHFRALYLDSRNGLLGVETVAIGSLNATMVHPREVFKAAILLNAAALVLVHNHPSGATEPSDEDIAITKTLKACGELLGIEVMDHVVIGEGYCSLAE